MASPKSKSLEQAVKESAASSSVRTRSYWREGIAAVLLYVVLMEWLRPLAAMSDYTDIHMLKPFILTFAFFMLLDYVRLPLAFTWFLKIGACLVVIGLLFYRQEALSFTWLGDYLQETLKDLAASVQLSMDDISPQNRTLMFLLGWAMLISVMYSTVVERQQSLWLTAATLVYLIGMQLVADVDTTGGVLRTFAAGMLLLAVGQLSRVVGPFELRARLGQWSVGRWSAAAAVLMAVAIGAGVWLSRDEAPLAKPVQWHTLTDAWMKMFPDHTGVGDPTDLMPSTAALAAWTGYSNDDSRLGGPVQVDDRVAFTARTEQPTYWRGESRSTYTGRGWVSGPDADAGAFAASASASVSASAGSAGQALGAAGAGAVGGVGGAAGTGSPQATSLPRITIQQEILLEDPSLGKQLFAGGVISDVSALVTGTGKSIATSLLGIDPATGRVAVQSLEPVVFYRLAVQVPADGKLSLAQAASSRPLTAAERAAMAGDLQLPAGVPERVRDLARTAAAGADTDYSRALAVETYLRSHYQYSLNKPTLPSDNEDFVDHFLFEDKVGYCNHFSTAMVVMLRTLGIPARWVKGFAPGELSTADASPTDTMMAFTVSNRDAHSWVEAYMQDQGWVLFEPTPGFSESLQGGGNPVFPSSGGGAVTVTASVSSPNMGGAPVMGASTWLGSVGGQLVTVSERVEDGVNNVFPLRGGRLVGVGLLLLLPLIWWGFRSLRHSLGQAGGSTPNYRALRAYDKIWAKLYRKFGQRREDQTIREYVYDAVRQLPEEEQREALLQFAGLYESVRYAQAPIRRHAVDRDQLETLWQQISRTKPTPSVR